VSLASPTTSHFSQLQLSTDSTTNELLLLVIQPRHGPRRKRLFHYCVFPHFRRNNVSTELFPCNCCCIIACLHTWSDNEVRKLIAVEVLHTSLLNITMVVFKVLPLGSYASMLAPSLPFKIILELVLWNDLQSCRLVIPDIINVLKMPSFLYFLYLLEHKKSLGARSDE
jgi:hypothetical protein